MTVAIGRTATSGVQENLFVVSLELANKLGDMGSPLIERFFAFGEEIVPLIDSSDS